MASLTSLPIELRQHIASFLEVEDYIQFKSTSRKTYDELGFGRRKLLVADQSTVAINNKFYACFVCMRMRPKSVFPDRVRNGRTGRNGKKSYKRLCWDCGRIEEPNAQGFLSKPYRDDWNWSIMGKHHYRCAGCNVYVEGGDSAAASSLLCASCYAPVAEKLRQEDLYRTYMRDMRGLAHVEAEKLGYSMQTHWHTVLDPNAKFPNSKYARS